MQTHLHKAKDRGHANHGWLNAHHSFSFASYYDPHKISFGALRVLNDDTIEAGMGFGTHPHDNMEIITIPLEGAVKHADNTGQSEVISVGEVQVMSAGTGIEHSEFNASQTDPLKLLQIWIFPDEKNLKPDYAQHRFNTGDFTNQLKVIVGGRKVKGPLIIHQNAVLSMGKFEKGLSFEYQLSDFNNGVYLFLIDGKLSIGENHLSKRDALGMWDLKAFTGSIEEDAHILILEVPK